MKHEDHINLIQKAISLKGGTWADLGSGWGAFTLALRELAGVDVEIYSVDINPQIIVVQKENFRAMFPETNIHYMVADYRTELSLPPLDGILMANSLHFVKDQVDLLTKLKSYLKPNGKLVIVEYDSNEDNMWVPYPLSFEEFKKIAQKTGYEKVELLDKTPSTWMNGMYSAEAFITHR